MDGYLPGCPDGYSQGRCLRWYLATVFVSRKIIPHSFVRSTEDVLKSPWPFWVKLPHAERPSLARQGPADQHYLDNVDKIDIHLNEASDVALQSPHFVN